MRPGIPALFLGDTRPYRGERTWDRGSPLILHGPFPTLSARTQAGMGPLGACPRKHSTPGDPLCAPQGGLQAATGAPGDQCVPVGENLVTLAIK